MTNVERAKKGFTLIELLVVIAIIALLMAVIIPALQLAKDQARKAVCAANLNQLGKALETYEFTYDYKRFATRNDAGDLDTYWMGKLAPFFGKEHYLADFAAGKTIDVLMCPSAPVSRYVRDAFNGAGSGGPSPDGTHGYWGTTSAPWEWYRTSGLSTLGGYTINGWTCYDYVYDLAANYRDFMYRNWLNISPIVPLFGDSIWPIGWPRGTDLEPVDLQGSVNVTNRNNELDARDEMRRFCIDRHRKEIVLIYKDLHTESLGLESLWQLRWHKDYQAPSPGSIQLPSK